MQGSWGFADMMDSVRAQVANRQGLADVLDSVNLSVQDAVKDLQSHGLTEVLGPFSVEGAGKTFRDAHRHILSAAGLGEEEEDAAARLARRADDYARAVEAMRCASETFVEDLAETVEHAQVREAACRLRDLNNAAWEEQAAAVRRAATPLSGGDAAGALPQQLAERALLTLLTAQLGYCRRTFAPLNGVFDAAEAAVVDAAQAPSAPLNAAPRVGTLAKEQAGFVDLLGDTGASEPGPGTPPAHGSTGTGTPPTGGDFPADFHYHGAHRESDRDVCARVEAWRQGKNLRSLLLTLQEVAPGWRPVALGDLQTAAAVKASYRRAVLTVHPDKQPADRQLLGRLAFDALRKEWDAFRASE